MTGLTEDKALIRHAIDYVSEIYRELSQENGSPTPGTQNQAVDFILADPEMSRVVREWGERAGVDEATAGPPRRLSQDETYWRVAGLLRSVMEEPVFERAERR